MGKRKSPKVDFTVMSDKICIQCGKKIKANIVNRKPTQKYFRCFKCWMQRVGAERIKKWEAMQKGILAEYVRASPKE